MSMINLQNREYFKKLSPKERLKLIWEKAKKDEQYKVFTLPVCIALIPIFILLVLAFFFRELTEIIGLLLYLLVYYMCIIQTYWGIKYKKLAKLHFAPFPSSLVEREKHPIEFYFTLIVYIIFILFPIFLLVRQIFHF